MKKDFFEQLSGCFAGCDGGNLQAKVWMCGIEWGGESPPKLEYEHTQYHKVGEYLVPFFSQDQKNSKPEFYKAPFSQKSAKIMCAINGREISEYRQYMADKYLAFDGDIFRFNLFPLPAKNVATWTSEHHKLTGCEIKYHYYTHCASFRFPFFASLALQFSPRVILCFGTDYLSEYRMAFWGDSFDLKTALVSEGTLTNGKFWIHTLPGKPIIVLCPFLSRNLNADVDLETIGRRVRELVNT